jgi:5'-3' exonuclease
MGIKGLSTPVIRDTPKARNTNVRKLLNDNPEKNIIGVDISVLIVKSLQSSRNATSLHHSEPKQPLSEIVNKVTDSIQTLIRYQFKVVCVFDGITHPLKKEGAHVERYGKDSALRSELENLYIKGTDNLNDIESIKGCCN